MIFNMKKIITTSLILISMTSATFAADEKSFFGQIKGLFIKEAAPQVQVIEQKVVPMQALTKQAASSTTGTPTSDTDEGEDKDDYTCEQEKKLSHKKSKTEKAIKDQVADRNKITKSLSKLEVSVDASTSLKIKEKRVQLEKEVRDVTDLEDQIITLASSSIPVSCSTSSINKKLVSENINKIKKLDLQVVDEADGVTSLIQKDIKDLIKSIDNK